MTKTEYPSQKKYRDNNPAVTFRLKTEDKERLDIIIKATGKSLSKYMTDFVHELMDPNEEVSELIGRIKVLEEWIGEMNTGDHFSVPCSVCGKPMNFSPNYSNWMTKVNPTLKQAFGKWKHTTCKPKLSPSPTTTDLN